MKHLIICTTVLGLTAAFPGNPSVASSHPTAPACRQPPGVAVPNANTARKIATAVISARQAPEQLNRYRLVIEPDGEMTGYWRAWQIPSTALAPEVGGSVCVLTAAPPLSAAFITSAEMSRDEG